jgi:hypothetical protein
VTLQRWAERFSPVRVPQPDGAGIACGGEEAAFRTEGDFSDLVLVSTERWSDRPTRPRVPQSDRAGDIVHGERIRWAQGDAQWVVAARLFRTMRTPASPTVLNRVLLSIAPMTSPACISTLHQASLLILAE